MVLSGGLTPIASRVCLDVATIVALCYCSFSSTNSSTSNNGLVLVVSCLLTLATAGMTCRWTLTLPMIPIVALQGLRRLEVFSGKWSSISIAILSTLFILVAALLSILFPAVQLPPIEGEYTVGIVKLYLPVNFTNLYDASVKSTKTDGFVSARILYPTLEEPKSLPYLDRETALDYCKETMALGAPPPLKEFGFILHNLRLIQMRTSLNAPPLNDDGGGGNKLPLVVYSHGLGGTAITYSYQTQHLAAQGHVVLVLDHTDGSALVVLKQDGTRRYYDFSVMSLSKAGDEVDYVRERRVQTIHRAEEVIASAIALSQLNERNIPELESAGVSFVDKLNTSELHFMGHSHGAATALTAASRRPDLASSVIAHEPATDWMPDDARRALFVEKKLQGGPREYMGGTGGFATSLREEKKEGSNPDKGCLRSLHDIPMLFLFSDQWKRSNWGFCDLIEYMHQSGELGPKNGVSHFEVIKDARHTEFSDTSLLTPLWLARSVGVTGTRDPKDTAQEIKERTVDFIASVRSQKKQL